MTLNNDIELANTRAKLARLEARYEALNKEAGGDEHVRDLTMQSVKKYINQFKEEIGRYQACGPGRSGRSKGIESDVQLTNTRAKLADLEMRYAEMRNEPDDDEELRDMAARSFKRLINQLKEEIVRYEAHRRSADRKVGVK